MHKAGWIAIAFVSSFLASVALTFVYALGGQPQLEGALLGVALGGVAFGLAGWARAFMPQGPHVQQREPIPVEVAERPEAIEAFAQGTEEIGRRRFLGRLLGLAVLGLGGAAVFPVRSLGSAPGRSLFATAWGPGVRAVREDDTPVRASDIAVDSILTVFPEGHTDDGDAPAVLIRLAGSYVAFSKLCTHAGCPVGLYQAPSKQLFCPCHQSVFDVADGARPTSGPATRALPRLPIEIDADGFVRATGDFSDPVGPGFWNRGRR